MEPRPAHNPNVLQIPEVARRLGVHPQSAYAAAARGEIPARRIGRRWVVPAAAFERWLGHAGSDAPTWPQKGDAGNLGPGVSTTTP